MTHIFARVRQQWLGDNGSLRHEASGRHRGRACADSRSDRLLDHRRGRSPRRALRFGGDCHRDLVHRRQARHDLRRDRRGGRPRDPARPGPRGRISLRGVDPDGPDPDCGRDRPARPADAIRVAIGDHRFRQCAGDPHLHGPASPTDQRDLAGLRHGRCGPGDHLPAPTPHQGGAVALGGHPGACRAFPSGPAHPSTASATWGSCRKACRRSCGRMFR